MKNNICLSAKAKKRRTTLSGFTLLEVLMVIGILAILAGVVLVAINPSRQFKIARDSQRTANVSAILNAIGQNMTDHGGTFTCEGTVPELPTTQTVMASVGGFDISHCIVPDYLSVLPYDPSKDGAHFLNETDYNTGYSIIKDVEGRLTISAEGEIATSSISVTR
jgi:type IV pilus assembly protein PilA